MKSAVIIGGGFGGLTTGALLAREGMDVTVIEKNHNIGGGLQSFRRDGIDFETGMHILGGFTEGDSVYRIFDYIGIMDRLQLKRSDADCMDQITYLDYTGTPEGSAYGIARDITLGMSCHVPQRTKLPGLYLTGQNINSHGILGVLVGSIVTCSDILGTAYLYQKIKDANK